MTISLLSKKTNFDYFQGLGDANELLDVIEHIDELKKYPPKSKRGIRKQRFYQNRLKKWRI